MSNMVLGFGNNVLGAAITASASSPGLGTDKLQDDQCNAASALQIPSTSGTITLTMPTSQPWRAFGLFRTNLTAGAVVTWSVGGNGVGTSLPVVPGYGQAVLVLGQAVSATSCSVSISDPANPDGFLSIGGMYTGDVWQPRYNFGPQSAPGRADGTVKTVTRAGSVLVRSDWIKRTFELSLQSIVPDEIVTVMALDLFGRQGGNVLFIPDPAAATIAQDALFGEFEPSTGLTYPYATPALRAYAATITERL